MSITKKLMALAIATTLSTSAFADNIMLDHDGDGDFLEISKLNLQSTPQEYTLIQYLGDDGIFNNGDTFSESVTFAITDFANWDEDLFSILTGNPMLDADLAALIGGEAKMTLTADLSGYVSDVISDDAQIAIDIAAYIANIGQAAWDALSAAEQQLIIANISFSNTSFSINFDMGLVKLFTDNENCTLATTPACYSDNDLFANQIGQWTDVDGFGDSPADTNGKPSTDFGFEMAFDTTWFDANPLMADLWKNEDGEPMLNGTPFLPGALSTINSSARPQEITGFGFDGDAQEAFMNILIRDDGGSMEFSTIPEPGTIAMFGLALVGLAGFRRRA